MTNFKQNLIQMPRNDECEAVSVVSLKWNSNKTLLKENMPLVFRINP